MRNPGSLLLHVSKWALNGIRRGAISLINFLLCMNSSSCPKLIYSLLNVEFITSFAKYYINYMFDIANVSFILKMSRKEKTC